MLDVAYDAFLVDDAIRSDCTSTNAINIYLDIHHEQYNNESLFLGVTGYLFPAGTEEDIVTTVCSAISPRCQRLAMEANIEDACSVGGVAISFDNSTPQVMLGHYFH
mmetsp:Transcript_19070/g.30747  ORF Transcript_19070/g.30747 Transcript_19070/m.30747 type:complete len:107 (+) Transcript_19070:64-384(+)